LITKIKNFWVQSYRSDKTAFWIEMFSALFTITGSLTLALSAKHPDMASIYPLFFLGSSSQVIAAYRRGAAWVMVLTFYFSCANIFGYCVAKGLI
jgi:hypothetical protein